MLKKNEKKKLDGQLGDYFQRELKYTPDEHDYSFLSEFNGFSVGNHARLLQRLMKVLDKTDLKNDKLFLFDTAEYTAKILCRALGMQHWKDVLFFESIFPKFASRPTDASLIFDIAMLIAGNINILKENQIIVSNYNLKYPVWIPMTVVDVRDDIEKPQNKRVSFFADSGIFAGSTTIKYMTSKFIRFVLSQIGVNRRARANVLDIFGTKLTVLIKSERGSIEMAEFDTSSSQEAYNKRLFKVRHGDRPCLNDMTCSCAECIYGTDRCEFAVYKKTEET